MLHNFKALILTVTFDVFSVKSDLVRARSAAVSMAKRARPQDAAAAGAHHSGYQSEVRNLLDQLEKYDIPRYTKRRCDKDGRSQARLRRHTSGPAGHRTGFKKV